MKKDDKRGAPEDQVKKVWGEYEKGLGFNNRINLEDTVETNENFFIGKQWEGVSANGLPTPVFNFLKRVTLFSVASVTSDNLAMQATPLSAASDKSEAERIAAVVNGEFERLFETNKVVNLLREYMRSAAVDGDGCLYTYWDPEAETGEKSVKGAIVTEIVENTRVFFGNANDRRVQKQPYIIIASRRMVDEVRDYAKENGVTNTDLVQADSEARQSGGPFNTDDKVTVLLKLWRNKETGTIWGYECTRSCEVRPAWDLGLKLYPLTWLNWDYVQDCYHGQALITGLIPNQIFINKLFAMSMLSLMTTAYPKIVYDKTRVSKWDNRVGAAIGINGGDVGSVAKIIDPAQISPQIAQFIELAVNYTQTFLGATPAALGDTRPDNTSAIIALQRAASTPSELTKQNLYQSLEDLGRIYIDFMGEYYGVRTVDVPVSEEVPRELLDFTGLHAGEALPSRFDFDVLGDTCFILKLDVGASSYWSEIASMQTLDNLLMQGKLDIVDYIERVPNGYISSRQELLDKLKGTQAVMSQMQGLMSGGGGAVTETAPELPAGGGYSALQRKINETGEVQ